MVSSDVAASNGAARPATREKPTGQAREDPRSRELAAVDGFTAPSDALAISNAIARLHKQYVGCGPSNTRTTVTRDLVICLLEGGFTPAERALEDQGHHDLLLAQREGLNDAMEAAMVDVVQSTLHRRVRSVMTALDLRHHLHTKVFVLHPITDA